jgi:SWI/SNF-related matrix-associated actin-dependent regulator 1 of chromatin subfamily A
MVRRLKADVLTELPPKRRQVIELAPNGAARVIKAEQSAFEAQQAVLADLRSAVELARVSDDPEEYGQALRDLREGIKVAFTEISEARRTTARAKVKHVVEHIKTTIDSGVSKIVLFAHHLDVVAEIETALTDCGISSVTLTGKQSMAQRDEAVEAFQNSDTQVFIGGIKAAGVGLTLTAASLVIFAELDWVPSTITQCEDRCHRIGQTGSVLVQHLVLEGSIDANMANTLVSKQAVLDDLLDTQSVREAPIIPHDDAVTISDTELKQAQDPVPTPIMGGILHALRHLASLCDGAQALDGQGFNKWDSRTGKSLAGLGHLTPRQAALGRKIIQRYRRQLDSEMLTAAGVSPNNQ